MTLRKAVLENIRRRAGWRTLASVMVLGAVVAGCKSQQTQSQPPAQPSPSQSSSSSSSQSQSQSSSSSSNSSSSRSQSQSPSSGMPSSSSSSQPSQGMPSVTVDSNRPNMDMPTISSGRESSRSDSSASRSGEESSSRRSSTAGDSMPDPTARGRNPSTPVYSDSDQRPEDNRMPPDPSTDSQGEPPDEVDFSEEEQTASSSSSASSSSASASSSAASASSAQSGQPGGAGSRGGNAPNEAPASAAERVAELEGQFESTMVSYDGMILRERDYVRNRPTSAEGEGEEGMDEPPPGESLEDLIESAEAEIPAPPGGGAEGSGPEQNNSSGQATGPGLPTAGRKGEYDHSNSPTVVPADIPDGNDDDVVARQIREAATRETDPELREKLWEEYRKYKRAQQ